MLFQNYKMQNHNKMVIKMVKTQLDQFIDSMDYCKS